MTFSYDYYIFLLVFSFNWICIQYFIFIFFCCNFSILSYNINELQYVLISMVLFRLHCMIFTQHHYLHVTFYGYCNTGYVTVAGVHTSSYKHTEISEQGRLLVKKTLRWLLHLTKRRVNRRCRLTSTAAALEIEQKYNTLKKICV